MKNLFYFSSARFLKSLLTKNLFALLTLIFLILPQYACNTTEPPGNQTLTIKLEDVSCTEAWIQLTTNNLQLPTTINILKNNTVAQTFSLSTRDTLLYIDSLLPNQTYKFKVVLTNNQQPTSYSQPPTSNELSITTMDTTSHNFTWQTFEFGVITNQSHLFDVTIINENNIWAVGEIYMLDSLGRPDPNAYNAVHWDGTKWELKRIYTYSACSSIDYAPLKSIYAFAENHIVVTSGGGLWWFDGNKWNAECSINPLLTGAINKLWGSSSNDLYAVGNNGNIAHWDGRKWTKIESGTEISLSDILDNSSNEIFICGGNPSFGQGIILKSSVGINFSTFVEGANIPESQLFNPRLYGSFSSIWFDHNSTLYSGGNILFQNKFSKWSYVKSLPENFIGGNPGVYYRGYITKVRGNASNDMWIVGDRNTVRHFNGLTWQQIGMPYDPQIDLVWRGMACKDNNTVIVGTHNRSAIIMMIKN